MELNINISPVDSAEHALQLVQTLPDLQDVSVLSRPLLGAIRHDIVCKSSGEWHTIPCYQKCNQDEQVNRLAYELWQQSDGSQGSEHYWLRAKEIMEQNTFQSLTVSALSAAWEEFGLRFTGDGQPPMADLDALRSSQDMAVTVDEGTYFQFRSTGAYVNYLCKRLKQWDLVSSREMHGTQDT